MLQTYKLQPILNGNEVAVSKFNPYGSEHRQNKYPAEGKGGMGALKISVHPTGNRPHHDANADDAPTAHIAH